MKKYGIKFFPNVNFFNFWLSKPCIRIRLKNQCGSETLVSRAAHQQPIAYWTGTRTVKRERLNRNKHNPSRLFLFESGLWIRIRKRSVFIWITGSGSVFRIGSGSRCENCSLIGYWKKYQRTYRYQTVRYHLQTFWFFSQETNTKYRYLICSSEKFKWYGTYIQKKGFEILLEKCSILHRIRNFLEMLDIPGTGTEYGFAYNEYRADPQPCFEKKI
jgi:hypothetical protein